MKFLVIVDELRRGVRPVGEKNKSADGRQAGPACPAPRSCIVMEAKREVRMQLFIDPTGTGLNLRRAVKKQLGIPADQVVHGIPRLPAADGILEKILDGLGIKICRTQVRRRGKAVVRPHDFGSCSGQPIRQSPAGLQIEFSLDHWPIATDPESALFDVRPVPADMSRIETNHPPQKRSLRIRKEKSRWRGTWCSIGSGPAKPEKGLRFGNIPKNSHPVSIDLEILPQGPRRIVNPFEFFLKLGLCDGALVIL